MNSVKFELRPGQVIEYKVREVLANVQTKFQRIQILDTLPFGKMVFIDGYPQSSDRDERLFNEVLIHSALSKVEHPKRVFIAGGGPGGALREALKYPSVEEVVLCDIDQEAVSFYREHLSAWNKEAFADARTKIVHADARNFLENSAPFDAIVIDVPDPLEEGTTGQLFTQEFYRLCKDKLSPDGVFATQAGRADYDNNNYFLSVDGTLKTVFSATLAYAAYIPCYSETWSFIVAGQRSLSFCSVPKNVDYADEENLKSFFHIAALNGKLSLFPERPKISTDKEPLIVK